MIFGAGLGSRLGPLTRHLPKPLVPIGDEPVLFHIAKRLAKVARGALVVNAFHAAKAYEKALDSRFLCVFEPQLLGTAGGLRHASAALGSGAVLLWNGDMLTEYDPACLVREHHAHSALATLAVCPLAKGQGNVGFDASGRIVRLRQTTLSATRGVAKEQCGGAFIGMHVVSPELRAVLPELGCMVGEVYVPLLERGALLRVALSDCAFFDIGTPQAYVAANLNWLQAAATSVFVHPSAVVTGVASESVVGASARIEGNVDFAVIWPHTQHRGDVKGCILSPEFCLNVAPQKMVSFGARSAHS
jgi:mannose-1-phosphate guanylyltransferase